jgi:uncharacterized protein YgiM (DUF1202 family)
MRVVLIAAAIAFASCRNEAPLAEKTDTREAVEVLYVGAPELKVHAKRDDASRVMSTFLSGESVPILARSGDWVEVRITNGSGWAHASDLMSADAAKQEEENPSPKFQVPPSPVTQPGAHGEIYVEAQVNDQGEIGATRIITNTTGSVALAEQNIAALKAARFYPIVRKGQRKQFVYYYRVDY